MEEIFPEETIELIEEILKENNLWEEQERGVLEFFEEGDEEKKEAIFENLPGRKLAKIVRSYLLKEISPEELGSRIEENLMVSPFKAEEIARKIKMTLTSLEKKEKESVSSPISPEERRKSFRDSYREPVD